MGTSACMSGSVRCSFGTAPATLVVIRPTTLDGVLPVMNIMDYAPVVNMATFGSCNTVSNPTVASATSAASGVLTPMPCVPATAAPWIPTKPTVLVMNMPAVNNADTCVCSYGGVISFNAPGQTAAQL